MNKKNIALAFNICICICGQDDLVSRQEEEALVSKFKSNFSVTDKELDDLFSQYFLSKDHIDSYLEKVADVALQKLILEISEFSASADGLDTRENIALQRAKLVWGIF